MEETEKENVGEKQKKENSFELVEIATQTGLIIQDPEGKQMSPEQLMVHIANELRDMKTKLIG